MTKGEVMKTLKIRLGRERKRNLKALGAAALCGSLLLAACGGSTAPSSSSTKASTTSANLGWFFWTGTPAGVKVWTHNATLVTKKYPNIHVSFQTTTWTDYWQKLPLEAATHSMSCLAGLQYGYVGSVGKDFIPLNSLIKKYHYNIGPFNPTMIRELSVNGKLLALPYDFGPVVIAYNKALFKAKGVPYPTDGWTWSQFLSDAKKLTGGGDYGYLPNLGLELDYDLSGVPDAYIKNGKFNLTNSAFEKGITPQAELSYKYHVAPTYSEAPNWAIQEFDSGKIGMETNGPWGLDDLKEQSSFPVGWVEFPAGPDGMHTYNEGSGFGITRDCKNVGAAFKALTVLVDSQALSNAASAGRAFPARLADDHVWSSYAGEGAGPVMAAALKPAQPQEVTSNWTAFQTAWLKYEPLVLSGSISTAKFAADVQAEAGPGVGVSPGNLSSLLGSGS
jgi:multiple sugar transport system substrate-binding protein